jgi:hypothetical protein
MAFKCTRYLISFSNRLTDYLNIIIKTLDFLLNYIILLGCILLGFSYAGFYFYGPHINDFSTIYKSFI